MQRGGYRIPQPFDKYFPNDSIVKERTPSRSEKANECNRRVTTIMRKRTRVLVESAARIACIALERDYHVETFDVSNYLIRVRSPVNPAMRATS